MGAIREGAGIIEDLITGKGLAGVAWKYASKRGEEWIQQKSSEKTSFFGGQKGKQKKVIEDIKKEYQSVITEPQVTKDLLKRAGKDYQYGFGKLADHDDDDADFPTFKEKIGGGSDGGIIVIKAVPFFLVYDCSYSNIKNKLEESVSIDHSKKSYCEALYEAIVDRFEESMKTATPNAKHPEDAGYGWYIIGVNKLYPWSERSTGHCYVWKPAKDDCRRQEHNGEFRRLRFPFRKRALPRLASKTQERLSAYLGTMNQAQLDDKIKKIKEHWYKSNAQQ